MMALRCTMFILLAGLAALASTIGVDARPAQDQMIIRVDRDNVVIANSCLIEITAPYIEDLDGNGVIQIIDDDITVRLGDQTLRGADPTRTPELYTGTGILVTGQNVTIIGGRIEGFNVGLHAREADGLNVHQLEIRDGFRQRLSSTSETEHTDDWLWPHENDAGEWASQYGAGVLVERSSNVMLQKIIARDVQNGIMLDRVRQARITGCDCSFLSGWGLSLWRSSDNLIRGNAFDFCVRGYSHGVYNRGQDSAGILLFEQCSRNRIIDNSATHCGDGLFAFAGREALGEVNPRDDINWYRQRGNNENVIVGNDFSDCVAHGLELTFSFNNRIHGNAFARNGITGIWAGYSQATIIDGNTFRANGDMGYGLERGGINIEHGVGNKIIGNSFEDDACAIHLWRDDDPAIAALPWSGANAAALSETVVRNNVIAKSPIGIHLRDEPSVKLRDNEFRIVNEDVRSEGASSTISMSGDLVVPAPPDVRRVRRKSPVGQRADLDGRAYIVMTPYGPFDFNGLHMVHDGTSITERGTTQSTFRLLGRREWLQHAQADLSRFISVASDSNGLVTESSFDNLPFGTLAIVRCFVRNAGLHDATVTYAPAVGEPIAARVSEVYPRWFIRSFPSPVDPREDIETWREAATTVFPVDRLGLSETFGDGGPSWMTMDARPVDHFGTIAETTIELPAGTWWLKTTSDDGIRVWIDDQMVIDDWTWHPPREQIAEFELEAARTITIRVEHFELDGYAVLDCRLYPVR
ncbi:MAG: right-handed parallel beta-helix repeat-containing protein [Planctomycetota bacterium]